MSAPIPRFTQKLIAMIGVEETLLLLSRSAGVRFYVPKKHGVALQRLGNFLGRDAAEILSKEFGGETLQMPLSREWRMERYLLKGYSTRKIAPLIGVTERAVWRFRADYCMTAKELADARG